MKRVTHGPQRGAVDRETQLRQNSLPYPLSSSTTADPTSSPSPPPTSAPTSTTSTGFAPSAPSTSTTTTSSQFTANLKHTAMEGWSKLQSSLSGINFAQAGTKFTKGFNSSVQATRERLGQVAADEITELPQGECIS
jgi:hypothetical protein